MVHRPYARVQWRASPCRALLVPGSVQALHQRERPSRPRSARPAPPPGTLTHTRAPHAAPPTRLLPLPCAIYRFFLLGPIAPVYLQYSMMQHMQMARTSFCSCVTPMSSRRLEMREKRFAFRAGACPALIESAAPA